MQRGSLGDLRALVAVGREMNFTKVTAKLGVSHPALSRTIPPARDARGRAALEPDDAQRFFD